MHLKSSDTAEKAALDSYQVEIESIDIKQGRLTVSDSAHHRLEIPFVHAPWAKSGAKVGTLLKLILDGEKFIKLTPPVDFKK